MSALAMLAGAILGIRWTGATATRSQIARIVVAAAEQPIPGVVSFELRLIVLKNSQLNLISQMTPKFGLPPLNLFGLPPLNLFGLSSNYTKLRRNGW
jgi:hypothetical protein